MADLQAFGEGIWIVDGPEVWDTGVLFTTRMTIVKLSDGAVWIESPVAVSFETLRQITDIGPIRYLLAATNRHLWRLDEWHHLFPDAELWSARVTAATLKKGDLPLTGILDDSPPPSWADDFEQLAFAGNPMLSEVLFYHKPSHTLLIGDLVQTHQQKPGKPILNMMFRWSNMVPPHGGVGVDIRLSFFNRKLARQSLERLLAWDFDRVIIAHGPCIEHDARAFVEDAFRWLPH